MRGKMTRSFSSSVGDPLAMIASDSCSWVTGLKPDGVLLPTLFCASVKRVIIWVAIFFLTAQTGPSPPFTLIYMFFQPADRQHTGCFSHHSVKTLERDMSSRQSLGQQFFPIQMFYMSINWSSSPFKCRILWTGLWPVDWLIGYLHKCVLK